MAIRQPGRHVHPAMWTTGHAIGHYRILSQLGAGGMGEVYLAEDVRHQRRVALKLLRPELAHSLGPERFLREIETAGRLRHPHILPLYDSGEADGTLFFVMPLVEGESLRSRLDREKQLPLDDALRISFGAGTCRPASPRPLRQRVGSSVRNR